MTLVGTSLSAVTFAADCKPCQLCGEPYCHRHKNHYADCPCDGPDFIMPKKPKQDPLFESSWQQEWQSMPEFVQEGWEPYATITIRVASEGDLQELAKLLGQPLTKKTKSIWHPRLTKNIHTRKVYTDEP